MSFEMDRQGIEVEFQQVDKKHPTSKYVDGIDMSKLSEIHHGYHPDDGKVEVNTDAFENLGDLAQQLETIVSQGLKVMNEYYHPITIGCTPFFADFASAHVHNSVKKMTESTWVNLRQQLYSAQPLIDLLGQNSPQVNSMRAADVRMLLSNWSTYTDLDSQEQSHWFAVAYGLRGQTIEVRIPSSAPLFQTIGMAAILRVILEDNAAPIAIPVAKDNWQRVMNYGSSSLCEIAVPSMLRYDGFKHKRVMIKTTDLWKLFLDNYAEQFDRVLGQLPKNLRINVRKFYSFIAAGHTLSDSYYEIINRYYSEGKESELAAKLAEISIASYNGGGVFDILPENPKPFMPLIEKYYTIEEVTQASAKLVESDYLKNVQVIQKDVLDLFLNTSESPLNNSVTQSVITTLLEENRILRVNDIPSYYIRTLTNSDIIRIERSVVTRGNNFSLAASLCKEAGVI